MNESSREWEWSGVEFLGLNTLESESSKELIVQGPIGQFTPLGAKWL